MNDYPFIGVSRRSGTVVEFTAPKTGTVLELGPTKQYFLGYHSTGWVMKYFSEKQTLREYMTKLAAPQPQA